MSEVNVYSSTEESSVCLSERLYSGEGRTVKKSKKRSKPKSPGDSPPPPSKIAAPGTPTDETTRDISASATKPAPTATTAISTATPSTSGTSLKTAQNPHASSPRTTTPSSASAGTRITPAPTTSTSAAARPPPIHVAEVSDFEGLCYALEALVGSDGFTCRSRVHDIVIAPSTPDSYRAVVRYLAGNKFSYHTYQLQTERSYRVVMRGLNHRAPVGKIRTDIENQGHQVRGITNVLDSRTKRPLPLFFIDLEPAANNADIFDVSRVFFSEVRIEEPYRSRSTVQCTRCQEYQHTKGYCNRPPRCVRCGGGHESSTCLKTRETPATCALCGGDHPANYKGCQVYKELQERSRPGQPRRDVSSGRARPVAAVPVPTPMHVADAPPRVHQTPQSASPAARSLGPRPLHPPKPTPTRPYTLKKATPSKTPPPTQKMKLPSKAPSTQNEAPSRVPSRTATPARTSRPQRGNPIPQPSTENPYTNLFQPELLIKFIAEFKSLANGLMSALTSLSNILSSFTQTHTNIPPYEYQ
ncbi:hypothetical protein AAG570_005039 [Ranatra chinensis]|uniref:Pre-C2HC domain-containing protein n=1 Tax=Ranatra chinensis TaxID=642074 RepID=A0ABD0XZB0_9HEMI